MDIETEYALFQVEQKFAKQLQEYRLTYAKLARRAEIRRIDSENAVLEIVMNTHRVIESILIEITATKDKENQRRGDDGCYAISLPIGASQAIAGLVALASELKRIADHFDPPSPDIVDSPCSAGRLGCTTTWVADMARSGEIPKSCVVPGTGSGKPWKFYRTRIEDWIRSR